MSLWQILYRNVAGQVDGEESRSRRTRIALKCFETLKWDARWSRHELQQPSPHLRWIWFDHLKRFPVKACKRFRFSQSLTFQNQTTCGVSGLQCLSRVCCFQSATSILLIPQITSSSSRSSNGRNKWFGINSQKPKSDSFELSIAWADWFLTFLKRQELLLDPPHEAIIYVKFHILSLVIVGHENLLTIRLQLVYLQNTETVVVDTEGWSDWLDIDVLTKIKDIKQLLLKHNQTWTHSIQVKLRWRSASTPSMSDSVIGLFSSCL